MLRFAFLTKEVKNVATISILLRDVHPEADRAHVLEEVRHEDDDDGDDGDDEHPRALMKGRLLTEFVRRASSIPPRPHQDIYIGIWGSQTTLVLPHEFLQFAYTRCTPVTIDLND